MTYIYSKATGQNMFVDFGSDCREKTKRKEKSAHRKEGRTSSPQHATHRIDECQRDPCAKGMHASYPPVAAAAAAAASSGTPRYYYRQHTYRFLMLKSTIIVIT